MSKPSPSRYRTTNWKAYNAALKKRGSLLIWLDKELVWLAPKDGRERHPLVFSSAAIQFCLMVKVLFGLPLRQIEPCCATGSSNHGEAGWSPVSCRWPGSTGLSPTSPP